MSPFHRIDVLHDGRIVRIRRSNQSFQSVEELQHERVLLGEALNRIGRAGRALLVDSRDAPHSTDERMAEEFRRFRLEVARGFDAVATVVRTKVGILQVRRLGTEPTAAPQAFDDEAAALAYLLEQCPPGRAAPSSALARPSLPAPRPTSVPPGPRTGRRG